MGSCVDSRVIQARESGAIPLRMDTELNKLAGMLGSDEYRLTQLPDDTGLGRCWTFGLTICCGKKCIRDTFILKCFVFTVVPSIKGLLCPLAIT
jgi:hypothetical protein